MSNSQDQLQKATQRLMEGGLVAFPTETVYGLGADASNLDAVAAIFQAKGRPLDHPVIVHVAPDANLLQWAACIPDPAQRLIDAFWPGPLTLILPKAKNVPYAITGGQETVGLRCPSHPVAQRLLAAFQEQKAGAPAGVAAPSANRFGQVSPTKAQHVLDEFPSLDEKQLFILSGGNADVGIESTIVDVSRVEEGVAPVILRPGHIRADQLEQVLGHPVLAQGQSVSAPRVSGSLKAHYAPRTPLFLVDSDQLAAITDQKAAVVTWVDAPLEVAKQVLAPDQAEKYASQLYAMLRELDDQNYSAIYVQKPPCNEAWAAVNDRLNRAAAAFDV